MAEVTKEDINRIYDKMQPIAEGLVRIEERLKNMPQPAPRPCSTLTEHLEAHKENKSRWQTPLVSNVIGLVRMGLVALVTWLLTRQ